MVSCVIAVSTYNFVKCVSNTGISANVIILLLKVFEPVKVLSFANILSVSVAIAVSTYNLFVKSLSITGIEALVILLLKYLNL
jgi:hypothetical protein